MLQYTMVEGKLKKKIQYIVISAMAVFFSLIITLSVQFAIRGNQRSMEASLMSTQTELQKQLEMQDILESYYLSDKFIEEYALRILGYGKDGAKIFESGG